MRSTQWTIVGTTFAMLLGACSGNSDPGGTQTSKAQSTRTVRIKALDSLTFDPAGVTIKVGEKVRFVVANEGETKHEFILGDEAAQSEHEGMGMGTGMDHGGIQLPALELAPGETKEATVLFDRPATILYGCHEPGHYKGGMVGIITVTA